MGRLAAETKLAYIEIQEFDKRRVSYRRRHQSRIVNNSAKRKSNWSKSSQICSYN